MNLAATCNPRTNRTMSTLPSEIITDEIFSKLPAKSLVRFKCVSKSFETFISSPEFIDLHLRQSRSSDSNRLLILAERYNSNDLKSIDVDSSNFAIATIPIRHLFNNWLQGLVSIVGSFNGLICIGLEYDMDGVFEHILINPSTRVYCSIPHKQTHRLEGELIKVSFGFAFDDINYDYKLVRIAENYIQEDPTVGDYYIGRDVMVYSVKRKSWKLVEDIKLDKPSDSLKGNQNGVLMKNHLLHWVFWSSYKFTIYCFDARSDKWCDDVPLMDIFTDCNPDLDKGDRVKVITLGVVDGCLCASTLTNSSRVVWVMKEYGVKESWVKLFTISRPVVGFSDFLNIGPFGFRRVSNQEILVRRDDESGLYWCDIRSGTYGKTEEIKGFPAFDEACFLMGSLVPIPGGEKFEP